MGTLVEQQEETVENIETTAKDVEADTDKAYAFVFVGKDSF
jgi:t-SNARE complex subunit (syntaxin)